MAYYQVIKTCHETAFGQFVSFRERQGSAVLSDFLTEDLVQLNIASSSWEDAIRKSVQPLVDNKKVTEGYVDDIIKGVNELGPYIVITEHVALPHARPESGVLEPAIGITVLKDSVEFGSKDNDPVKFLFPLAAKDSEGHLSALQSLVELLSDSDFFAQLEKAQSPKDVVDLVHAKEGRL